MEALIGTATLFSGSFVPKGWAACQGQALSIVENAALFSLLGTTFGGDGHTTFCLPDLRKAKVMSANGAALQYIIALFGIYPSRP